jgi:orotate phosphoribosyltransferase
VVTKDIYACGIGLREAPAPGEHDRVESRLIELACPRYGHFDLGTGYHGDVWLDLDRLFLRPALLRPHVRVLADRLREHRVDAVCGPMEGGAFLACALADLLGVAFLPAYRAPASAAGAESGYRLAWAGVAGEEIGGRRVAVADDAVNAGTAVRACAGQLRKHGAVPVAVAALMAVGPANQIMAAALSVPFYSVDAVQSRAWLPADCPLCADGVPLTDSSAQG